jgi:hypothetical protein
MHNENVTIYSLHKALFTYLYNRELSSTSRHYILIADHRDVSNYLNYINYLLLIYTTAVSPFMIL